MGNVNMEASQINYRGGETKMSVEEALKNTSGEAAAIAQLQTDVLNLNSNKANQITIAPFFSAETSYDPGDLVYYNGLSYRCVNAHEGEWDSDDFAATTISGELDSLKSGLTNKAEIIYKGNIASATAIQIEPNHLYLLVSSHPYNGATTMAIIVGWESGNLVHWIKESTGLTVTVSNFTITVTPVEYGTWVRVVDLGSH